MNVWSCRAVRAGLAARTRVGHRLERGIAQQPLRQGEEHALLEADVVSQQLAEAGQSGRPILRVIEDEPAEGGVLLSRSCGRTDAATPLDRREQVLLLDGEVWSELVLESAHDLVP